jgi:mannose-6-phosphate isomerase-like protein (cupin superfamily)
MNHPRADDALRYRVVHMDELDAVGCPCGSAKRAFGEDPDQIATLHVVNIKADSQTHYHKKLTELYFVLEGEGQMELDGRRVDIRPGSAIMIKPGCRHRAIGNLKILNVPIPAFDPEDEWFD